MRPTPRRAGGSGTAAAALAGTALVASVVSERRPGLYQRVGLTAGNAWVAASALRLVRAGLRGSPPVSR